MTPKGSKSVDDGYYRLRCRFIFWLFSVKNVYIFEKPTPYLP